MLDSNGRIYVANGGNNRITIYPAASRGNLAPSATIADPGTGLHSPYGIALDQKGNVYVANHDFRFDSVTIYSTGSDAAAPPTATISGPKTGLNVPAGVAVDASGDIYVANMGTVAIGAGGTAIGRPSSVTVYSPGSKGNVKPIATISGVRTGLDSTTGIAVDSAGKIYVVNSASFSTTPASITVYAPRSKANVSPIATITGPDTGLDGPAAIALDSDGNIYVANLGNFVGPGANSVTVYAAGSNGDAKPIATIAGPDTGLDNPNGIALDATGNIYVTNSSYLLPAPANAITVYARGSNGDAMPIATISGGATGLAEPLGIAISP